MLRTLKLFFLFFLFPFAPAWALTFDWSGWSRLEAYYQSQGDFYADLAFTLNSQLNIQDAMAFNFRLDLIDWQGDWKNLWEDSSLTKNPYHQKGYVFLSPRKNKNSPFIFPTQFYFDYQREFLKVRVGRGPYHFALGANHSALQDPFALWISSPDQISVHIAYQSFYVQPSFFHQFDQTDHQFFALLQAGMEGKDWKLQALYEQPLSKSTKDPGIELYGEYEQSLWQVKANGTYSFIQSPRSFMILLEGLYRLYKPLALDLQLKMGWVEGLKIHPNYNIALLLGDRLVLAGDWDSTYPVATGQLEDILYLAPHIGFYLLERTIKLETLFLLAYHKEELHYEWDLFGQYKINDSLFFKLKAGALYNEKNWSSALLAQAAVSF